jgi:hypothetical protein
MQASSQAEASTPIASIKAQKVRSEGDGDAESAIAEVMEHIRQAVPLPIVPAVPAAVVAGAPAAVAIGGAAAGAVAAQAAEEEEEDDEDDGSEADAFSPEDDDRRSWTSRLLSCATLKHVLIVALVFLVVSLLPADALIDRYAAFLRRLPQSALLVKALSASLITTVSLGALTER